ncbi:MAG: type II 3-dehydroquinate dehydratase [Solirubrobacteraceae bacterium]|nr:type II 3-dehydroquinate dehydratase [Solirubrobacteraceae bacterium]
MRRFRVAVVHGVNLDQLGRRDPAHYGRHTLRDLESRIDEWAGELGLSVRFFQTNHEGAYVEYLHRAEGLVDGLILNPGAWTHYAWAIHDALEIARMPAVEVHLSDLSTREEWRRRSVIAPLCVQTVSGEGAEGYRRALTVLREHLDEHAPPPPVRTTLKPEPEPVEPAAVEGGHAGRAASEEREEDGPPTVPSDGSAPAEGAAPGTGTTPEDRQPEEAR